SRMNSSRLPPPTLISTSSLSSLLPPTSPPPKLPMSTSAGHEEKLEKLKDITVKTIDNIILKIAEMKREKQFLQSFQDVMRISESLVEIEKMLDSVDLDSSSTSSSSSSNQSTVQRSVSSVDSLHAVLQLCLDNIKIKMLSLKVHIPLETSIQAAIKNGEIIRNIRNQLNAIRTITLPDSVSLIDGEKLLLKVEARYHFYDNVHDQQKEQQQQQSSSSSSSHHHHQTTHTLPPSPSKEKDLSSSATSSISTNEEEYVTGTCYITNFQLIFNGLHQGAHFRKSFSIHSVGKIVKTGKKKSAGEFTYRLNFLCKDCHTFSFSFDRNNNNLKNVRHCVNNILSEPLFCFTHKNESTLRPDQHNLGWNIYDVRSEYARMGVPSPDWKISQFNNGYFLCDTYPSLLVVPASVPDEQLKAAAQFRSKGRIPALSYCHWSNRTSITRCSQPLVGIGSNRSRDDEQLLNAIRLTASTYGGTPNDKTLYIIDARPYANAVGNRAKGAGWEIMTNYANCEIEFMGIANIHAMRHSLLKLREGVESSVNKEDTWYATLESSGWFNHLKLILAGAVRVAKLIHINHSNVLVHCSDGWDRTSQLVSLAEILLDPYFRTIRGFQMLIEKEWLSFGHKFAQRCGQVQGKDEDERSPVFIQFLEAVYQIINQFPNKFEFNAHFLRTIYTHAYSGRYGNFLYNCEKERIQHYPYAKTLSLWFEIDQHISSYMNPLYQAGSIGSGSSSVDEKDVLFPDCSIKKMKLWRQIYFPLADTDIYEVEERFIRQAFEKQLEERAQEFATKYPLLPIRLHTASVSNPRRPTLTLSQQQLNYPVVASVVSGTTSAAAAAVDEQPITGENHGKSASGEDKDKKKFYTLGRNIFKRKDGNGTISPK
ncbi:hypothetical protein SAMD00019534_110190, partial [Acytostelium subglobosum LB1]|uniref:hypothetical protein n=1 Tax=Acytostelium subglobosum LB1 TaxID=1410327 RepID=UPI0006451A39